MQAGVRVPPSLVNIYKELEADLGLPRAQNGDLTFIQQEDEFFDVDKGFGFVELANGAGDAFLHIGALQSAGYETVPPGAKLKVTVGQGMKGAQVTRVVEVDTSTASAAPPARLAGQRGELDVVAARNHALRGAVGNLSAAASNDVTLTVSDGALAATAGFLWNTTAPPANKAPVPPGQDENL